MKKNIFEAEKPPKGITPNLSSAAVLCATWFDLNEWIIGEKIAHSRNLRYAARLRGALASLRETVGNDANLLVPLYMPWREEIAKVLESLPEVEENSSNKTQTAIQEEE